MPTPAYDETNIFMKILRRDAMPQGLRGRCGFGLHGHHAAPTAMCWCCQKPLAAICFSTPIPGRSASSSPASKKSPSP